ncbi:ras-related protein Rab-33B-like [Ambystoma mexicanum]|uniref:ras-related protein Rab-33B-like n=1 Tax=Ambystoma mexicanum TaxID=8296 RepID=UPI0037E899E7
MEQQPRLRVHNAALGSPPLDSRAPHYRIFKIIVIGDSCVGKTCMSYRFCGGRFLENTEATIGVDFRERTLDIDGERIKIQLWDTAGQERFQKGMVEHYYRNVHAVVFVYDVTKFSTFQNLPHWFEDCSQHRVPLAVPRVLVGNKCDLKEDTEVPLADAQRLADRYGLPLFVTSAKDPCEMEHIESIFLTLAYRLKNHKTLRLQQLPLENRVVVVTEDDVQSVCLC